MPFLKTYKTPNGATAEFHKVTKVETTPDMQGIVIVVTSWASQDDYLNNKPPCWTTYEHKALPSELTTLVGDLVLGAGEFVGASLVADPDGSLEAAKARKKAEINQARLKANRSTFPFAGKDIQCDELSRSDIDGVQGYVARHSSLPASFPGGWKTVDNSFVAIPDVETWDAFYGAMLAQGTANFMKAQGLKADVDAATTIEEVNAVMW
jgi:hypothetical protein